jgi:hypothetical protein
MGSPCTLCDCVCESPLINFWLPKPFSVKLDIHIYHDTWAHLSGVLLKSLPSVCVSVCVFLLSLLRIGSVKYSPPFIARQRLDKHVPTAKTTPNNRTIVGLVCLCVCLRILLSFLGNNSVETFPRQQRIFGKFVFYAVRIISKESRRPVLPRISCFYILFIKCQISISTNKTVICNIHG